MAPAGSVDAGYAALHYGADSIYLGLKKFSARADAANFTPEELDEITAYAHSLAPRRKIFVTLNTLVLQDELPGLIEQLGTLADIGVDAVIIQDLGVFRLAKKNFPALRLHGSTQMAVHNRAGVEALKDLGFARATLARELTIGEIREIVETVPGIETETFIHGALCYSYSGLCLFSSHRLGRSGNRGRCAYLCRDEFTTRDGKGGFVFSMKDLALPQEISELAKAGVTSFKIEGRMKSPLYVAATTHYYRKLIDGKLSPAGMKELEADIQTIFSRPWTELYARSRDVHGVVDSETVGHRGTPIGTVDMVIDNRVLRFRTSRAIEVHDGLQIDIPGEAKPFGFPVDALRLAGEYKHAFEAQADTSVEVILPAEHPEIPRGATVYHASSQEVKQKYPFDRPKPGAFRSRRSLDVSIEVASDKLVARAAGTEAAIAGSFSPAKDVKKTEAAARGAFEKLGDTRFVLGRLELENPGNLFVPVSQMNELRRQLAEEAEKKRAEELALQIRRVQDNVDVGNSKLETGNSGFLWSIKVDRVGHLDDFTEDDWGEEVVVEIALDPLDRLKTKLAKLPRERVRLALPMITRKWEEEEIAGKIVELQRAGWTKWEIANVAGWRYLKLETGNLATDWSVYVTNSEAARQVMDMGATRFTLSPEDGLDNMEQLLAGFGEKATVVVYQDTPLFISETCVRTEALPCPGPAKCRREPLEMTSSHGDDVIAVNRDCRTILIGKDPFCLGRRLDDLKSAGAVSLRADFISRPYKPPEVLDLWRALRRGKNPPSGHIGNFDRGLM